jgi:hypothetical protein
MTALRTEDITVGEAVTIFALANGEPSPFMGMVLRVQAVDFPFVAAHVAAHGCVVAIDTRTVTLKRLSPAYVAAMTTPPPPPPPPQPVSVEDDT